LFFLCGKIATVDRKHPERNDVHEAKSDKLTESMLRTCDDRMDNWGFEVKGRILTCGDLHAADAVYHGRCRRNFTKIVSKRSTSSGGVSGTNSGRSANTSAAEVFDVLCCKLESEENGELDTIDEMGKQMECLCGDKSEAYSGKYVKQGLQEKYGENIFFADVCGRKNVLCLKNNAQRLINDKWYAEREDDVTKENQRIVDVAAKLIKASIRECVFTTDEYPLSDTIRQPALAKQWVPPLLSSFLAAIISDEVKQTALGHSIVQACRPRSVISPVLFGTGVSVDHVHGSTTLLEMMSRLGFSVTADEVNRFKQSVVQMDRVDDVGDSLNTFTQWAADNVDHNVATLSGQDTFHGMGVISMSVQCGDSSAVCASVPVGSFGDVPVKRLPRAPALSVVHGKGIHVHFYKPPNIRPLSCLHFRPVAELQMPYVLPTAVNDDLLWHVGWYFRDESDPRPNWSGFMRDLSTGSHLPAADIRLLPIIDLNPSDRSCVLSTLLFVISQAKRLNMETPCVTFDQPLWIKAVEVIMAESLDVVCRLGVFHMIMSFLGSIGTVMCGSGLVEAGMLLWPKRSCPNDEW